MEEKLYNEVILLKELISNSKEAKELLEIDKELNDDLSFKILSSKVNELKEEYERFSKILKEDDLTLINKRKEYHLKKKELDNHPLTIKYMEAYKKVKEIYNLVNEEIFDLFNKTPTIKIWLELLLEKIKEEK